MKLLVVVAHHRARRADHFINDLVGEVVGVAVVVELVADGDLEVVGDALTAPWFGCGVCRAGRERESENR